VDPAPELPDDTSLDDVELPTRIRDVLAAAGLKTSAGIWLNPTSLSVTP
jgi:hypothetical protein